MKPVLVTILIISLIGNLLAIAFIVILTQTSYLDIPLASYSHYKNCEKDFSSVLGYADKVPVEKRDQVKQMFATLICQKDYKTGQPTSEQDFQSLFQQIGSQAQNQPAPAPTPAPAQ